MLPWKRVPKISGSTRFHFEVAGGLQEVLEFAVVQGDGFEVGEEAAVEVGDLAEAPSGGGGALVHLAEEAADKVVGGVLGAFGAEGGGDEIAEEAAGEEFGVLGEEGDEAGEDVALGDGFGEISARARLGGRRRGSCRRARRGRRLPS